MHPSRAKRTRTIRIERPQYFASEIVKFLQGERAPELPASTVAAVSTLLLDPAPP
jgi:hypothetical protein